MTLATSTSSSAAPAFRLALLTYLQTERVTADLRKWATKHNHLENAVLAEVDRLVSSGKVRRSGSKPRPRFQAVPPASIEVEPQAPSAPTTPVAPASVTSAPSPSKRPMDERWRKNISEGRRRKKAGKTSAPNPKPHVARLVHVDSVGSVLPSSPLPTTSTAMALVLPDSPSEPVAEATERKQLAIPGLEPEISTPRVRPTSLPLPLPSSIAVQTPLPDREGEFVGVRGNKRIVVAAMEAFLAGRIVRTP